MTPSNIREVLKEAMDTLIMASLIDKSNTCEKMADKIKAVLSTLHPTAGSEWVSVEREKISVFDLFMLDVESNNMIKEYRQQLGLETPNNRIDTGDLKMIIMALTKMGFEVVKCLPPPPVEPGKNEKE